MLAFKGKFIERHYDFEPKESLESVLPSVNSGFLTLGSPPSSCIHLSGSVSKVLLAHNVGMTREPHWYSGVSLSVVLAAFNHR